MTDTARPLAARAPFLTTLVCASAAYAVIVSAVRFEGTPSAQYHTPTLVLAIHLATVIPALPLGAYVLWARKGTATHKMLGCIWAVMMMISAVDSIWVRETTGGIGPIHALSALTLVSIPLAIYHIRNGNVAAHRRAMMLTYAGLVAAGLFAMLPGRMMGNLVFG